MQDPETVDPLSEIHMRRGHCVLRHVVETGFGSGEYKLCLKNEK